MKKIVTAIGNWIKPRIIPLIICLTALGGVIYLAKTVKAPEQKIEKAPEKIINVEVTKIVPRKILSDTYKTIGTIEENFKTDVSAELPGRVVGYAAPNDKITTQYKMPTHKKGAHIISEGSFVKKGQPLMYLDTKQIKPKYDKAYADYKNKEFLLEKNKIGLAQGVVNEHNVKQAQADFDSAKATFEELKDQLNKWIIRAPITGELNKLPIKIGEYVTPGKEVAEIVDLSKVKFVVNISSADVRFMYKGKVQKIQRDLGYGEHEIIEGPITYISKIADKNTRTTRVEILLDNPLDKNGNRKFLSGDQFTAMMQKREIKNAIVIPLRALIPVFINGQTQHYVYVAERIPGEPKESKLRIARRRLVKKDLYLPGNNVLIISGLKAGEELITRAAGLNVGPEQKVIIRPHEDPFRKDKKMPTKIKSKSSKK